MGLAPGRIGVDAPRRQLHARGIRARDVDPVGSGDRRGQRVLLKGNDRQSGLLECPRVDPDPATGVDHGVLRQSQALRST